ncbi:hypothetical protein [Sphingomonas sp. PAMC 26605]|uniref:hypothetical protein n=1 Tax=Sphingomonas sp. PAMC 26605 TaxID=1112214 RepID=UPI0002E71173|nr:hypothetical protein [Sphingomonas sp. PAMC 26605]
MIVLLLAAQAATPAPAPVPAAPTAFSILQPVADEPCVRRGKPVGPDDIVVCGKPLPSQKLPYPNEVVPKGPVPSNPYLTGTGALAVEDSSPCATMQRGCTGGVQFFEGGTQVVRLIQKVVAPDSCCERPGEAKDFVMLAGDVAHGVGRAFKKKPDKSGRVAIALDDAPHPSVILP